MMHDFGKWGCRGILILFVMVASRVVADEPWGLVEALGAPEWIQVDGAHRVRYEMQDGRFRTGRTGGDQIMVFRSRLKMQLGTGAFQLVSEGMDSRQVFADTGTPVGHDDVNALEMLQGYARWRREVWEIRGGRQTLDLGSRRLVARNGYRNTVNAHTGLFGQWNPDEHWMAQAFFVLPVQRLPGDGASLLRNQSAFDHESWRVKFMGLRVSRYSVLLGGDVEAYVYGLHESDGEGRATRNRRLATPGLRWVRKPAPGAWDYDLETIAQLGNSRATGAAADVTDLNHRAFLQHAALGYTIKGGWAPRVAALVQYAGGDDSPVDGRNGRFDHLYGGRRFELGPTGIYGAVPRSNMIFPGMRLSFEPAKRLSLMFANHALLLASKRDAWTTSGLRDPSGNSGRFLGQQLEARVRWDVIPINLRLESGVAHLFAGDFVTSAPNTTGQGDVTYAYWSALVSF